MVALLDACWTEAPCDPCINAITSHKNAFTILHQALIAKGKCKECSQPWLRVHLRRVSLDCHDAVEAGDGDRLCELDYTAIHG